jgi:hypothetical protein
VRNHHQKESMGRRDHSKYLRDETPKDYCFSNGIWVKDPTDNKNGSSVCHLLCRKDILQDV